MLINIYWPTLSFSHGCKKPSSQSQNCKKAYWIFRRFSGKMDRATTCAAVSSSFAVTRPIPHFRFPKLNLRSTSTRSHSSWKSWTLFRSSPFLGLPRAGPDSRISSLCSSGDSRGFGRFCLPEHDWSSVPRACGSFQSFPGAWSLHCRHQKNGIPVSSSRLWHWYPASCQTPRVCRLSQKALWDVKCYTKNFPAGFSGREFLAFSQNPLYQIFCRKSPVVKGLFHIFGIKDFWV